MNQPEEELEKPHIMQVMMKCRDDAKMSYNQHYMRQVGPFIQYIYNQMEENGVDSPVEMAVMMLEYAEQNGNDQVTIMNIMAAAMEIVEPSSE
jgi:hypothetical protein